MATYAEQIKKSSNHDELKVVGGKIFNAKIAKEKRVELIKLYRDRRRELDRAMVDGTTNSLLKQTLYKINNVTKNGITSVAKLGKELYDLATSGKLDKHESDLVFRAYRHQKRKAGIEFQPQAF
jgi:hypothetical protein